ncbi:MAG TPA: hypothetical protein VGZ90_13565 [Puia sp.]|jgi:hypothetical protein|nr:hypothetical protein [Puia sp.]
MESYENKISIADKNKVIAKFMGGFERYWYDTLDKVWDSEDFKSPLAGGKHTDDLEYNSDWSWIIPVIGRIWKMGKMVNINFFDETKTCECRIYNWGLGDPQQEAEDANPIKAVHQAVYDFIIWYNQQNKQP